ncbi:zinc finger protein RFP-like [Crotalus adamanteus]|uniref:Zinc finger protein RFP-like n=1 Tax=Crotalus adamanteus TaxID=8729 RepID=A0AAW1BUQ7_CROAD
MFWRERSGEQGIKIQRVRGTGGIALGASLREKGEKGSRAKRLIWPPLSGGGDEKEEVLAGKRRRAGDREGEDIGSILKKYQANETYENPVDLLPELKWTIWDYSDIIALLKSAKKKLKDTLENGLQLQEGNVSLNPRTADPGVLVISKDQKSVKRVEPKRLIYADPNCKRIVLNPYVLGCQRFSTGRHFWEVTVGDTAGWGVGVAKKPVKETYVDMQTSQWVFRKWGEKYMASSPSYSEFVLIEKPTRIRIFLNCEMGQVSFFDASTAALLHTFSDASLVGETLLPSFSLDEGASLILP